MTAADEQNPGAQAPPVQVEEESAEPLTPTQRLSRVMKRWEFSARKLLSALSEEDLTTIVASADSDSIRWVMEHLGLDAQWRRFSNGKLNRSAAFRPMAGRFQARLGSYQGRYCPATALLFGWWGRRAEKEFDLPGLREFLRSKELGERIVYLDEWMRDQGGGPHEIQKILLKLKGSAHVLDGIFEDLLSCVGKDTRAKRFEEIVQFWISQAKTASAQTSSAKPKVPPPEPISKAAVPKPAQEEAPAPAPVVSAPPPPAAAPAPPPKAAEPIPETPALAAPLAPEVEALQRLLRELQEATRESAALMARGQFEKAMEMTPRLIALRDRITESRHEIEGKLEAQMIAPPGPMPEEAYSNPQAAAVYLAALSAKLQEAEERSPLVLQHQREELIAQFKSLELTPPEGLSEIGTLREFRERKAALIAVLEEERALRLLLSSSQQGAREAQRTIPAATRLEFYERTARGARGTREPGELLEALGRDPAALSHDPVRGRRLIASLLIASLDLERPVPQGTWKSFGRLCQPGEVAQCLMELEVPGYLSAVPETLYDAKGLFDMVGKERERLPPELRGVLDRIEISSLPLEERIPRLARMALDGQLKESLLSELLKALAQAGRHKDAVLLAVLAMHASRHLEAEAAYESLLIFLVEMVGQDATTNEFITRSFLQDESWLHRRADDVAILLYLIARTEGRGLFENLQFQQQELLRDAERARPALVGQWLMVQLRSHEPVDYPRRRQIRREARQALREWDHDLLKESCYRSWDYAMDYQRLFREKLTQMFEELDSSRTFEELEPLGFIEEVGRARGLPRAGHPALPPMKKYLVEQLERLKKIERALPYLEGVSIREGLSREEPDLRAELEQELHRLPGGPAIRHIYQRAMERL